MTLCYTFVGDLLAPLDRFARPEISRPEHKAGVHGSNLT